MLQTITPAGMRALENAAFKRGVSPLLLMEKAAQCVVEALEKMLSGCENKTALFLCGPGNNGGDGLAAARLFTLKGGKAFVCMAEDAKTPDALVNFRYAKAMDIAFIDPAQSFPAADAVVDALFGTGFRGILAADTAAGQMLLKATSLAPILSVDVPSGMDALTGAAAGVCAQAACTVTFHRPKPGLYLSAKRHLVGEIMIADIGLDHIPMLEAEAGYAVAEASDLASLLPRRPVNAHKGDCGRVLIYAGSLGMAGAAIMAAAAALRAGAGLVTAMCPEEIIPILQAAVPNAMCTTEPVCCDTLLMGCGLKENADTWTQILALHGEHTPEVWDAGALNLLAKQPFKLGANAVITPHAGEAARLLGCEIGCVTGDLAGAAAALCEKYGCNVILKSSVSVIAALDGRMALNVEGSPALAKGGSGDMLSGVLAALLAQGLPMYEAMRCACLWHGLAAKYAAKECGVRGALTGDVIRALGKVENYQ